VSLTSQPCSFTRHSPQTYAEYLAVSCYDLLIIFCLAYCAAILTGRITGLARLSFCEYVRCVWELLHVTRNHPKTYKNENRCNVSQRVICSLKCQMQIRVTAPDVKQILCKMTRISRKSLLYLLLADLEHSERVAS